MLLVVGEESRWTRWYLKAAMSSSASSGAGEMKSWKSLS